MQEELKVALIQADLIWENAEENRVNFTNKIDSITETIDLVVLPEMFTTGFTMNAANVYETMQGETVAWMQRIADNKNIALIGSLVIKENNNFYNRLLFVKPSSTIKIYDKRHTFTLAGEHEVYTAGNRKLIDEYKGWKICPLVCYDLRFPVWARNVEDYDLLVYVANWPKPRIAAWDALLKARAIENMSYCIGVNRVGLDINKYEYNGHSAAYDVLGNKVSNIEPNVEQIEIVTLTKSHIKKYRERLQFLNDRDEFSLFP